MHTSHDDRAVSRRSLRRWSLAAVGVSLLLWMGCGGSDRVREQTRADRGRGRPGLPLAVFVDAGLHPSSQQDSLAFLDRLRPPLRVRNEPFENRHVPAQVDTLRTLYYRGLRLIVYDVARDPKEFLQSLTVTDSTYATKDGVRVGMRREEVRRTRGAPDRVEEGVFIYKLTDLAPNQLRITFLNGRVSRLDWSFYVD